MIKKITVFMLMLMFVFNSGSVVAAGIVAKGDSERVNVDITREIFDGPLFLVDGEDGPDIYG